MRGGEREGSGWAELWLKNYLGIVMKRAHPSATRTDGAPGRFASGNDNKKSKNKYRDPSTTALWAFAQDDGRSWGPSATAVRTFAQSRVGHPVLCRLPLPVSLLPLSLLLFFELGGGVGYLGWSRVGGKDAAAEIAFEAVGLGDELAGFDFAGFWVGDGQG